MDPLRRYKMIRHMMGTGDMLDFAGKYFISRAIMEFGGIRSSHVGGLYCVRHKESQNLNIWLAEAVVPHFDVNRLRRVLEGYKGTVTWYRLKPKFNELRAAIGHEYYHMEGLKYPIWGLIKQMWSRRKINLNPKAAFCSGAYYIAGVRAGMPPWQHAYLPWPGKDMKALNWHKPGIVIYNNEETLDDDFQNRGAG
jgi:hypothetical protein